MTVQIVILIAVILAVWFFLRSRSQGAAQLPAAQDDAAETSSTEAAAPPTLEAAPANEPVATRERAQLPAAPQPGESQASAPRSPVSPTAPALGVDVADEEVVHDVESLRRGLERSRHAEGFFGRLVSILRGKKELDTDIASQVEEVLLTSDVGVQTTQVITDRIRESLSKRELNNPEAVWDAVRDEARSILRSVAGAGPIRAKGRPTVIVLVGVNGAGKTTTIGKLATRFKQQGRSVLLAAGDTFRAAAVQQLRVWGDRIGVDVVCGKDGADPGSVIFEAVRKAKEDGIDVVLADTAGRLHTKSNLMAELKKVLKTTARALDDAPFETLLVVDATNGQNAVAQAKEFCSDLPLTGMVLTKLDGTAKGGFVIGIAAALRLPVRLIGLGEKATDLHDFDPDDFVEALLGQSKEATPSA